MAKIEIFRRVHEIQGYFFFFGFRFSCTKEDAAAEPFYLRFQGFISG